MRLRKPCEEHDRYEPHNWQKPDGDYAACPGGEFLPEGALVIEKVEGEWPDDVLHALDMSTMQAWEGGDMGIAEWIEARFRLIHALDALASQVGDAHAPVSRSSREVLEVGEPIRRWFCAHPTQDEFAAGSETYCRFGRHGEHTGACGWKVITDADLWRARSDFVVQIKVKELE